MGPIVEDALMQVVLCRLCSGVDTLMQVESCCPGALIQVVSRCLLPECISGGVALLCECINAGGILLSGCIDTGGALFPVIRIH